MFKNYLKIAFRNLLKNKVYSLINIFGLAIGMAACFFIFQYIRFELSYDKFHVNGNNIYRVPITYAGGFSQGTNILNHPAVGPAMKAEFPEVVAQARITPTSTFEKTITVSKDDGNGNVIRFNESRIFSADPSFLTMFSFPFLEGDPATALNDPGNTVISESIARKYFGNSSALNQTLNFNGFPLKVAGVFKDVPENSHIKFDLLVKMGMGDANFGLTEWGWPEFYNYVQLAPGTDPKKVEAKFPAFVSKYLGAKMKELNFQVTYSLQSLGDIHLRSKNSGELEVNGSQSIIYFLGILGVFIIVIAWINYINLSTAKSMERAREVGLRKVVGATRMQLTAQFIFESLIINCIALLMAMVLVIAFTPYFEQFIGKHIGEAFFASGLWKRWYFWAIFFAVFIAGALQVGAYPAFILSSFKPIIVLKGKLLPAKGGISLRKALVAFQFVLSIILIAGTITMYSQLSYMRNQELGYKQDQLFVVKVPPPGDSTFFSKISFFKSEIERNPAIGSMTASKDIPGSRIYGRNGVRKAGEDKTKNFVIGLTEIDKDFIPVYQMKLAAGTNIPEDGKTNVFETKQAKVLINETLVTKLGYPNNEAALHERVIFTSWFGDINCEIVGVVKNYHQRSLKDKYESTLFYYTSGATPNYFSMNVGTKDLAKNLAYVEGLYKKTFPSAAYESFFLDDHFNRQYQADQQFGNIFGLFTILAIIVACLGLIGLSTYAIKLRTKEIGIRKVLGSTTYAIVYLFSKDFIQLVGIAAVVAFPIIYLGANEWLSNFAFHISLSWFIFAGPPLLLLMISLLTIGWQSFKAALANPVNSLRNE
ncbi:ABC transporter permease [Chitinophaga niabensis]|uniref:Putative ABC transport system permease protein n=1 Tax=Chitinophaga niabensis TaxID=536979 RepID=A0A1N6DQS0_9BACT|nr:ABC transporter permease [Chitinophaga niabensis]SIN73023.1 putative ABC transport system permease protein [Chitinophaga niabensis]